MDECCRRKSFRASAICFGVASLGNTVKINLDLPSPVVVFDGLVGVSSAVGVSGGVRVFIREPYWIVPASGHRRNTQQPSPCVHMSSQFGGGP